MFTTEELKLLATLVADVHSGNVTAIQSSSWDTLRSVREKIDRAIKDGQGGGVYRTKPTLVEPSDDDGDLDWLDDDDELIKELVITEEQKLVSARGVLRAVQQRNDELVAKLAGLENVAAIQQENERLRVELEIKGPAEAHEEIAVLKRAVQAAEEDKNVLRRQVEALKAALHGERTQRQSIDAFYRPALTSAETVNVARLTGACTCDDPGTLNPDCPRHGNGNGALEP